MKNILKTSSVLFITAVIIVALVSVVYEITLKPIEEAAANARDSAMREVLPVADSFTRPENVKNTEGYGITAVYLGFSGGERVGCVLELSVEGYGGTIEFLLGISTETDTITSLRVTEHSESPGFGAYITEDEFPERYEGKNLSALSVVKTNAGENEVNAITGATITSRAITSAVNKGIEWYTGGGLE